MIDAAKRKYDLEYPWGNHSAWKDWWSGKAQAAGQEASQMFLYYIIARDLENVDTLIASTTIQTAVKLKYDRTNISVLDLYCAQCQHEELPDKAKVLVSAKMLTTWFADFELWFNTIKTQNVPKIPLQSSTKIAFFVATAASAWGSPDEVSEAQWEQIQVFLTQGPSKILEKLGMEYPSTRGKWPGQKTQIERTFEICQKIAGS